jgi:hypothetical protein
MTNDDNQNLFYDILRHDGGNTERMILHLKRNKEFQSDENKEFLLKMSNNINQKKIMLVIELLLYYFPKECTVTICLKSQDF